MQLRKYHGLGNDFLVALVEDNPGLAPDADVAVRLCDRHTGVGADGLILALEPQDPANDASMVLLNSDGSRAEISGNGIRCLAQALIRSRGDATSLSVETDGGVRRIDLHGGDPSGTVRLGVDMGAARPGPEVSAAAGAFGAHDVATVDIGNPHLVLRVDSPGDVDLEVEGPRLESDYPEGINVHFVRVLDAGSIELRVWERGAGVTRACGSGAVAAAVSAASWGLVGEEVEVLMPGGAATVIVGAETVQLIGPSTHVAEVVVP